MAGDARRRRRTRRAGADDDGGCGGRRGDGGVRGAHDIHSSARRRPGTPRRWPFVSRHLRQWAVPNAPAAGQALAVLQLHRAPRRAGARRRDRPRPRPAPLERLPPAGGAAPTRASCATCPRSAATAWASPPSSWARPTPARSRCSGSPGRCSPGWSTRPTHNAHLAVLHGRDVLYVVEERAAGRPPLVTDVGVRLPAPPDRQRPGDARRPAAGAGPGAVPVPCRLRAAPRQRARRRCPPCARSSRGYDATATPTRTARSPPASRRWRRPCSTTPATRSPAVAVTYPVHEVTEADRGPLATRVAAAAHELSRRIRGRDPRRAGADPGAARAGSTARA